MKNLIWILIATVTVGCSIDSTQNSSLKQINEKQNNTTEKTKEEKKFEDRFVKKNNLTRRELEILRHIAQAMSNKEIAEKLFISDQTVSVHRKNIMRKLGVTNTAGLIKTAYDNQLL